MTDDQNPQAAPPSGQPAAAPPPAGTNAPAGGAAAASPPVNRTMLIWFGVIIVVLSFVAAFLGSWVARGGTPEAAPTPTPTVDEAAYEEAIEEILPAGSAVRAGSGAPEAGKGYEGDVYIDITDSDVYLFKDGEWTLVGNIRESAAENLTGAKGATGATGATGAQGETGATGATGAQGEPGAPGTQVLLGVGAPANDTCTTNGDVYIDTSTVQFYECAAGSWRLFGPPSTPAPAPTEPPAPSDEPTDSEAPADTEAPVGG